MDHQIWSWLLTSVGLVGFILAGRRVWWCWYINIACQGLWFTYAIVTKQYGFIAASIVYTIVFSNNAIKWTRQNKQAKTEKEYTLMAQPGHYSDRLRKQFPPDDPAWNPPRDGDDDKPAKTQPLPKGVEGHKLGGRGKKN